VCGGGVEVRQPKQQQESPTLPESVSTTTTSPCLSFIFSALTCPSSTLERMERNVVRSCALARLDVLHIGGVRVKGLG
jgi:hypothetical protein